MTDWGGRNYKRLARAEVVRDNGVIAQAPKLDPELWAQLWRKAWPKWRKRSWGDKACHCCKNTTNQ